MDVGKGGCDEGGFDFALISFCGQTGNAAMADRLSEHPEDKKLNIVSALIRFYADQDESEKACIVYEMDILPC